MLRAQSTVIAFSQQPSVAEFMRRILADAGYNAIACWSAVDDLERVVDESDPIAVVYEVGLPFVSELNRFHDIRRRPAFAHRPFVIATAAPQDLCRRCGVTSALDIFSRPTPRDVDAALHSAVVAPLATDAADRKALLDPGWRVQDQEIRGAPPATENLTTIGGDDIATITGRKHSH